MLPVLMAGGSHLFERGQTASQTHTFRDARNKDLLKFEKSEDVFWVTLDWGSW